VDRERFHLPTAFILSANAQRPPNKIFTGPPKFECHSPANRHPGLRENHEPITTEISSTGSNYVETSSTEVPFLHTMLSMGSVICRIYIHGTSPLGGVYVWQMLPRAHCVSLFLSSTARGCSCTMTVWNPGSSHRVYVN
jgi:hypothetical protein